MTPRVLLLTTYYHPIVGGVETHARQLAAHLRQRGLAVQVVTKRVGDLPNDDAIDGVPVHRVGPSGQRNAGGKWAAVPAVLRTLLSRADEYDVIVCVDYRGVGVAAIAAARMKGRAVIAQGETAGVLAGADEQSTSGLEPESVFARIARAPVRALYRRADHIVCIGRDLEREALRAGMARERVHYLPHGVDVQHFRAVATAEEKASIKREIGWPAERPVVLFVGRLSREKGVMDLLEAWKQIADRDAILVFVGPDMTGHPWDAGGPGRAFVEANGLSDRVRFAGQADDPASFYRGADVFVQPSQFEALGNTAIEAMASGLPVVTSGVGGLADFCVHEQNALVYAPRTPAALAAAVSRALDDAALRARLGAAGRQTAVDQFELTALLDRYVELIQTVSRGTEVGRR